MSPAKDVMPNNWVTQTQDSLSNLQTFPLLGVGFSAVKATASVVQIAVSIPLAVIALLFGVLASGFNSKNLKEGTVAMKAMEFGAEVGMLFPHGLVQLAYSILNALSLTLFGNWYKNTHQNWFNISNPGPTQPK